jgi:hypothetical protein
MFFCKAGEYEACGLFSYEHFVLIGFTILGIIIALKKTIHNTHQEVRKIIKFITVITIIVELIRIVFNIYIGNIRNINEYFPLYYCSSFVYAGIMSSWCKGKIKRVGDVFLATGAIIGGAVFIILPVTSLTTYPAFHFLSIQSFIYHGAMIYIGLLVNFTHYIEIELKDIGYFSTLIGILCIASIIVNNIFDSNLMFISKDFVGTPISILYNLLGIGFTPVMIVGQLTLPFLVIWGIIKIKQIFSENAKK